MLRIASSLLASLRRHGEETYPHECCGILLGERTGDVKTVRAVVPCGNTRTDSPQNRYGIDPRDLIRVQREARERGLEIIGFYHSHPDHPARWSSTDLEEAHWPGCSYVITSVQQGKAVETNSFLLVGDNEQQKRFEEEQVKVEQSRA
jgi:proteasome lid subunit RPN8/RPN11